MNIANSWIWLLNVLFYFFLGCCLWFSSIWIQEICNSCREDRNSWRERQSSTFLSIRILGDHCRQHPILSRPIADRPSFGCWSRSGLNIALNPNAHLITSTLLNHYGIFLFCNVEWGKSRFRMHSMQTYSV